MHVPTLRVFSALAVLCPLIASAAPIQLVRTIDDPHPFFYDSFGFAMSNYDGDVLVGATGSKTVYLMDVETGAELRQFKSPDPAGVNVSFGRALVQMAGARIAVGDVEATLNSQPRTGSVYTFDANTGQSLLTIRNPNPGTFTYFGHSVEFTSEKLYVSSNSPSTAYQGKVYIFNPDTGALQATLENPEPVSGSWGFGFDLKRYHDDLLISATGNPSGGFLTGAVYLYDGATLQQKRKFAPPNPANARGFGWSIDVDGSRLLVGAPGTTQGGAAYLFDAMTGALLRTFSNPSPNQGDHFGNAVSLVGDYAVINRWSTGGDAHVFNILNGSYVGKITNPGDGVYFAENGGAQNGGLLTVGSQVLVAGWANTSGGQQDSGAIYLYSIPEPSTLALAACGLIALGWLGLRRRSVERH